MFCDVAGPSVQRTRRLEAPFPFLSQTLYPSKLALAQVDNHLLARNKCRAPQRRKVQRAAQAIREAKKEHGWYPSPRILKRKAALGHLVLLGGAAAQVVHAALRIHLGLILARRVGELGARQDVEVIIGRVASGVAFGTNGRAEDDQVLGDACGLVSKRGYSGGW